MLFVLSVAAGHLLTMLDGLALFLALAPAAGARRVGLAFAAAQAACVAGAFGLAALGSELLEPRHLGWLGLAPIALGVHALARRWSGGARDDAAPAVTAPFAGLTLMFFALSTDGLALLASLLADSSASWDEAAAVGIALALALVAAASIAALAHRRAARLGRLAERVEALTPWVMIAAGLYILADTATDVA